MSRGVEGFQHPRFAPACMRMAAFAGRHGAAEHRDKLLAGLSGRVIELGAGHGLNFAHYPVAVTEVLAVEPDDTLRARAETAAPAAPVTVTVVAGHGEDLPAPDASFDAAVASLVLCTVPDQPSALAELARVLRTDGELRFYEHVRSDRAIIGRAEDLITPLWSRVAGGCHPNRGTADAIRTAGFVIEEIQRIPFGFTHILGHARKAS
ncbi:MAG: class I SAM-dependent methyltransferase [Acidimicrobiales bacterium]